VKFGVSLPSARIRFGNNLSPEAAIGAAAAWANELGFDSVWVADHVLMPQRVDSFFPFADNHIFADPPDQDWMDPIVTLTWAGARAPDVQLATGVMVLPLRNPMLLAKQIATLDVLSSGRVILGVGVGWMREEFEALGVPFDERWHWTEEMVALMRRLWTGERIDFSGRFFKAHGITERPVPVRQPPILWGGRSRACLRNVAAFGDGWYPSGLTMDEIVAALGQLKELCAEYGRDFDSLIIYTNFLRGASIDPEIVARYTALGVQGLVCSARRDDIDVYLADLARIANELGLTPRTNRLAVTK
jgi:probable F420-dependent oxidoreductase